MLFNTKHLSVDGSVSVTNSTAKGNRGELARKMEKIREVSYNARRELNMLAESGNKHASCGSDDPNHDIGDSSQ